MNSDFPGSLGDVGDLSDTGEDAGDGTAPRWKSKDVSMGGGSGLPTVFTDASSSVYSDIADKLELRSLYEFRIEVMREEDATE
jgi:hypothetical protein